MSLDPGALLNERQQYNGDGAFEVPPEGGCTQNNLKSILCHGLLCMFIFAVVGLLVESISEDKYTGIEVGLSLFFCCCICSVACYPKHRRRVPPPLSEEGRLEELSRDPGL